MVVGLPIILRILDAVEHHEQRRTHSFAHELLDRVRRERLQLGRDTLMDTAASHALEHTAVDCLDRKPQLVRTRHDRVDARPGPAFVDELHHAPCFQSFRNRVDAVDDRQDRTSVVTVTTGDRCNAQQQHDASSWRGNGAQSIETRQDARQAAGWNDRGAAIDGHIVSRTGNLLWRPVGRIFPVAIGIDGPRDGGQEVSALESLDVGSNAIADVGSSSAAVTSKRARR